MLHLVITIALLGVIYWIISLLPIPEPFAGAIRVIFIVILVVLLLNFLGVGTGFSL